MSQIDNTLFHIAALLYSYNSNNTKIENILKKIIESMLVISGNKMQTSTELSLYISEKMNMLVAVDEIERIVCDGQNRGFEVDYSRGEIKFCLKKSRYDYIMNMNTRNMDSYIVEFIQLNGYTDAEKLLIEKYLYDFYRKNFNDLQHALGEGKKEYMLVNTGEYSKTEFEVIRKFNEWNNDGKNEQMLALANYALEYTFVAGETKLNNNAHIDNVFRGKNLYIDTNVLFYCLGINGEMYEESNKMFLRRCKRCQENIVVSYYTDAELRSTFSHFEEEINRLNTPLLHNARIGVHFSNDDVYHYYVKWARSKKQLNEAKYFIKFLYDKYDALVKEFNIKVEKAIPFSEEKLAVDEKLCAYETEIVRTSAINYDARNVYFIESKRKADENTLQNARDIFISADRNLQYWDMWREKAAPVVVSPNTWLLLIARLLGRDEDDFKCFISYINQANSEPVINNKEFFEVLKAVYETVEDVNQQESVIEVMVEEEFAFLNNNGEKRSPEFIREKTKERTYVILESKLNNVENQLEDMQKQVADTKRTSEEREKNDAIAYRELENKLSEQKQEYEKEKKELVSKKDATIDALEEKIKNIRKLIIWIGIAIIVLLPVTIELFSVFILKNENPISYQVFIYFYEKCKFDEGNVIEAYKECFFWIVSCWLALEGIIAKQVIEIAKKLKKKN